MAPMEPRTGRPEPDRLIAAELYRIAVDLGTTQKRLDEDAERILRTNLWDLYH